jgi:putative addiction module killer protein
MSFINEDNSCTRSATIRHYLTPDGRDLFMEWLKLLRDPIGRVQIVKRLNRIEQGNFGDHKFCRDGVWELRIDAGPGYRVYYAQTATQIVLLLCGGDKRSQDSDISRAVKCRQDWQRRQE